MNSNNYPTPLSRQIHFIMIRSDKSGLGLIENELIMSEVREMYREGGHDQFALGEMIWSIATLRGNEMRAG